MAFPQQPSNQQLRLQVSPWLELPLNNNQNDDLLVSFRNSFLPSHVTDEIYNLCEEQDAEISSYLATQGEQLRKAVMDKFQASQIQTLSYIEQIIQQKLHEKEAEVETLKKKNEELCLDAAAWKQCAESNESMIKRLQFILDRQIKDNNMTELMSCKVCRSNKICILLLPCKHICLCKQCDSMINICPVCHVTKNVGLEVYI